MDTGTMVTVVVIGSSVVLTFALLVGAGYRAKQWRDRRKPPFCRMCGISYHAPREEVRQPCAHNTRGTTHFFPGITPEPEPMVAWVDLW
jgi:hypothetical protein